MRVVVVGAGVGGLTVAAALARAGCDVTVLEAHVYAGGCAGTFLHQGYRFDAGATLAGGFAPGGPMDLVADRTGAQWDDQPDDVAFQVLLPEGERVLRSTDAAAWGEERRRVFGDDAERFWGWQERTADDLWNLALRLPVWPPRTAGEVAELAATGLGWLAGSPRRLALGGSAFATVAGRLAPGNVALRQYVDGQLLIAAQATSGQVTALYGASALDLPRRGLVHLAGGMGGVARALADALSASGGRLLLRRRVTVVEPAGDGWRVRDARLDEYEADHVIFNLPDASIAPLLELAAAPDSTLPADGWGASMVYVGMAAADLPADLPLHSQVLGAEPFGEGNSVFISVSPAWDPLRAPGGQRAITISSHTTLGPWWQLFEADRPAYEARKLEYQDRLLACAGRAIPGLRARARLILPGTPVTFQRFTRRHRGWVGGYPQTSLVRAQSPRLGRQLWRVGDSIFPGQSTAAVALGGLRLAQTILDPLW